MTVVAVRDTLIARYARRGYSPTGEAEPFPYSDSRFGVPRRDDLNFIVLRRRICKGTFSEAFVQLAGKAEVRMLNQLEQLY